MKCGSPVSISFSFSLPFPAYFAFSLLSPLTVSFLFYSLVFVPHFSLDPSIFLFPTRSLSLFVIHYFLLLLSCSLALFLDYLQFNEVLNYMGAKMDPFNTSQTWLWGMLYVRTRCEKPNNISNIVPYSFTILVIYFSHKTFDMYTEHFRRLSEKKIWSTQLCCITMAGHRIRNKK